jgi:hypothetical protein
MTYIEFPFKGKIYRIDKLLAEIIISICINITEDWDFIIFVSGNRQTRVGKSVFAMQVCAFAAYILKDVLKIGEKYKIENYDPFNIDNIFFDNKILLDEAQKRHKFSVLQYDEGREGLAASKAMSGFSQNICDFFAECGQLNHLFIIVAPDFFELKESIATGRSEILLNVFRDSHQVDFKAKILDKDVAFKVAKFDRGFFKLYNRDAKNMLYDFYRTSRRKDYNMVRSTFPVGKFENDYVVDPEKYKELKRKALTRFKEKHEAISKRETMMTERIQKLIKGLKEKGSTDKEIGEIAGMNRVSVTNMKNKIFDKKEDTGYVKID